MERYVGQGSALMCRVACKLIILAERNPDREYGTQLVRECIEELTGMNYKEFLGEYGQILDLYDHDEI